MTVIPIVALDVSDKYSALNLVDTLGDSCDFYKIGGELFTAEGPAVVREVIGKGNKVFLDLKFHDIPNTVKESSKRAAALGAALITVHASGGEKMVAAAVEGAGPACGVLAVTVLTSMDAESLSGAWGKPGVEVDKEVLRLAGIAAQSGAHGVVCSGRESGMIRDSFGETLKRLVPGIRLEGGAAHDQARVVTPAGARDAGASYIILGRAVTQASNPPETMRSIRLALSA